MLRGRGAAASTVVAALAFASSVAFAQVPPRPDAGQILEQQREPLRLPPPRPSDVLPKPPDPKPALPVDPQLRVTVKAFTFTGNTIFSEAFLQPIVQEYIGKQLNFDDLNEAATKVRAFHRERGYFLTQAYLPEQTIRDGVVQIGIIEGRIGEIEIVRRPATRLREGLLAGIVGAHWQQGDVITETGLEKPLLLINDLPTAAVTSEIRPSRTLGAADLRVNVDQGVGLFSGYVDLDNHGNRFTGQYRYGLNLNLNNPLTLADQASFRAFRTDEDMWFGKLTYLVPVWYYGTRVGASYSKFDYRLAKDFEALGAQGQGEVSSLFLFHPVIRTRNSNIILQAAYEDKYLLDEVLTANSREERTIESVRAGVVGDFRDTLFGGGLNSYSVTFTHGDLRLSPPALAAADAAATGRNTAGTFRKLNIDLRRLQRITDTVNLLLAFTSQQANQNLASAEKLSIGGPNGVRAYPVGEAAGDSARILQTELRFRLPGMRFFGGDVIVSGHLDAGWSELNHVPFPNEAENTRSFGGLGFGVSMGNEGDFVIRATASDRIGEPATSDPVHKHPRVWAQAIKWF
jgi:hemolysin activation/secretion protein